jgi:Flp pilus assembly protein TadD
MRKLALCGALIGALILGACKGKDKGATAAARSEMDRKAAQNEARLLASDADFAVRVHDYPRAEASLAKAVELVPDDYSVWVGLGMARRRQGNKDGARDAYQRGYQMLEQAFKEHPEDPGILVSQIELMLLLDRPADARKIYDRMLRDYPNHPRVKAFVDNRELDELMNNPDLRAHKV